MPSSNLPSPSKPGPSLPRISASYFTPEFSLSGLPQVSEHGCCAFSLCPSAHCKPLPRGTPQALLFFLLFSKHRRKSPQHSQKCCPSQSQCQCQLTLPTRAEASTSLSGGHFMTFLQPSGLFQALSALPCARASAWYLSSSLIHKLSCRSPLWHLTEETSLRERERGPGPTVYPIFSSEIKRLRDGDNSEMAQELRILL